MNGKTVFIDDDRVSTYDGRATWNGAPITLSASPGDVLQIITTNPGGVDIELSPLYLHVNGQSLKLSDGVPNEKNNTSEFFNESFTISIPAPLVSILDYSPSPVHGEEDLNVKVSWSNIPAGWKLVVSLEESELNYTRLAEDVSKMVSSSGEETFKLKVYPTTETHSEAKVCACLYNEKGEWTGIFEKKDITVEPTTTSSWYILIIALIIVVAGIFVVRRKKQVNPDVTKVEGAVKKEEVKGTEVPEQEDVNGKLKEAYPKIEAARLANIFRRAQDIRNNYCNTNTTVRGINREFNLLKMYLTEMEFLEEVDSIQRKLNAELREDERLAEKHVEELKDFCEKFTEMWIARFLR